MLVENIIKFLSQIECFNGPKDETSEKIRDWLGGFSDKKGSINSTEFAVLEKLFADRWVKGKIKDNLLFDYTFSQDGINEYWIEFAKELAADSLSNKTYIQILFPTVVNRHDFLDLKPLDEATSTKNMYLGDDDTHLFRKKSLCAHLCTGRALSTRRDRASSYTALTVKELARIAFCNVSESSRFSVNGRVFDSFWDFLKTQIFPYLNPSNKLYDFTADFYFLLELKKQRISVEEFKEALDRFLENLYSQDLETINAFYGTTVQYKGKKYYFIEILINLYVIENYCFNPNSIRKLLTVSHRKSSHKAMALLISLFNSPEYEGEESIFFWDIHTKVTIELASVYLRFEPALHNDDKVALGETYNSFLDEMKALSSLSLPMNNLLNIDDIIYYPAELLMHALSSKKELHSLPGVNKFLDDLIGTFSQKTASNLEKQLRVNILFTRWSGSLDKQNHVLLLFVLEQYAADDFKHLFIDHCIKHINQQLKKIEVYLPDRLSLVASIGVKIDEKIIDNFSLSGKTTVVQMLERYRELLNNIEPPINPILNHALISYIYQCSLPIENSRISLCQEIDSPGRDPLGAPT